MFFDAHCHLQDVRLQADLPAVMARARQANVSGMLCCGSAEADWNRVLELSRQWPDLIIPAFGLHPWYVHERSADWLNQLESLLRTVPAAVGEIGLDRAIENFDEAAQQEVFVRQLELARQLHRPVSIHCRQAWEWLEILLRQSGPLPAGGMIHSYSGSAELVPLWNQFGLAISYSGSITRENNKRGRKSLQVVPADQLLIETDCPDIMPSGVVGELNEPANLPFIARTVAMLRNIDLGELARQTGLNAWRIFGGLTI
jgi:TatD DNase family protein